jgi:hypothetical protein
MRPDNLKSGEPARLFPVLSEISKEGRTLSIFLACLSLVPDFSSVLFSSIGQRVGSRSRFDCYTEIVFKSDDPSIKDRPDGLIVLDTGRSEWTSLIEAKVGRNELTHDQIVKYCELAKHNGVDAIVTISNQFTPIPSHHPVPISKRDQKGVPLFHWSWSYVLTQARLLLANADSLSELEKTILAELVNFLRHDSSGIRSFDRMNPEWKDVVECVKNGQSLRKNDPAVQNTVLSWHQEAQDLSLKLSDAIQTHVKVRISRGQRSDPASRVKAGIDEITQKKALSVAYEIPGACSPLDVTADLVARTISCAMKVRAPLDMKRAQTRLSWLAKQLRSSPDGVQLKAVWPGGKRATFGSLAEIRNDNFQIIGDSQGSAPTGFEVSLVSDLGARFGGVSAFIGELEPFVIDYYEQVGQNLQNWLPPAPKVIERDEPNVDNAENDLDTM